MRATRHSSLLLGSSRCTDGTRYEDQGSQVFYASCNTAASRRYASHTHTHAHIHTHRASSLVSRQTRIEIRERKKQGPGKSNPCFASSRSTDNHIRMTRAAVRGDWVSTFDPTISPYDVSPPFQRGRFGIQTDLTRYKRCSPRHSSSRSKRTPIHPSTTLSSTTHGWSFRGIRVSRPLDRPIQFASWLLIYRLPLLSFTVGVFPFERLIFQLDETPSDTLIQDRQNDR